MCSPIPENSIISPKICEVFFLVKPYKLAFRKIFSIPVKLGLNPDPNSKIAVTLPLHLISPEDGFIVPEIICKRVLLPAPFNPTIPTDSPRGIEKEISFNAKKEFVFDKFIPSKLYRRFLRTDL
jgi:hypothetical protein